MTRRRVQPPGYTQIPNILLDEVMPVAGHAEWKVTCAIARKTFGWHEPTRLLSNAEICALTGLSRQSVTDALKVGEERGYIGKRNEGGNRWSYGIGVEDVKKADSCDTDQLPSNPDVDFLATRKSPIQGKENPSGKRKKDGADAPSSAKKPRSGDLYKPNGEDPVDTAIVELFEAWRVGTGRNGASTLTVRRAGQIRARLKDAAKGADDPTDLQIALAHARRECMEAVEGMVHSQWHRQQAQQEFDQLFRHYDRIDFFAKRRRAQGDQPDYSPYDAAVERQGDDDGS